MPKEWRSLCSLPDITIDEILCRLPIDDAIRTSILSRWWRHRWESIPDLNLTNLPASVVPGILLLHSGPIRLFKADHDDFPYPSFGGPYPVNTWLASISRRSASSLHTLALYCGHNCHHLHSIARYFPHLYDLDFYGRDLSVLFSACPSLEIVTLYLILGEHYLDIVAPNLRILKLDDLIIDDLAITSAPVLEEASIDFWLRKDDDEGDAVVRGVGGNNNLMKVLGGMAHARKLVLGEGTLMFVGMGQVVPDRLLLTFNYLRDLSLRIDFEDVKSVLVTLCILRSTPNLQQIEIRGCAYHEECLGYEESFWEAQRHVDVFDKIETVNLTKMVFIEAELNFLKFILSKARVLKTMMISFNYCQLRNKETVKEKILGFSRVSDQCSILFDQCCDMTGQEEDFTSSGFPSELEDD